MRNLSEAVEVFFDGDNERYLQPTKVPRLFLPTPQSPDQNLAIELPEDYDDDDEIMDIPFSFLLTPVLRKLITA